MSSKGILFSQLLNLHILFLPISYLSLCLLESFTLVRHKFRAKDRGQMSFAKFLVFPLNIVKSSYE